MRRIIVAGLLIIGLAGQAGAQTAAPETATSAPAATEQAPATEPAPANTPESQPAPKECKRLGFAVNDYGKEGPARDAKKLLDRHIAKWTAARGIKKYSTGPKHVSCKLFLDFGFFDEHTCTASATFCW